MTPRVRFAPSPSGHLHVGNVRTALFNWLFARRHGGAFLLRIEDTDTETSTAEGERSALDDLRWLGLDWDEGPEVGGAHAPYRQSERGAVYRAAAARLLAEGRAYHCFCTPETLEAERQAALAAGLPPKYSGRCRQLDAAAVRARLDAGEPAALRFAIPQHREVTFHDLVRGDVTFHTDVIGDLIILRSDGRPAYNFAVVVDDAAMQITHVVRGEDHISNTPRQLLLYEALGSVPPAFGHVSLVLGPDHTKLSKRHGATSVAEFRERGYLPESLVNYLALLGWSPGEGEEILPIAEMAKRFDVTSVAHSAAVFDTDKLSWINRHYMKEAAGDRIAREAWPYFQRAGYVSGDTPEGRAYIESLLPMAVGSVDRLDEIPDRVSVIFSWDAKRAADLVGAEAGGDVAMRVFAEEIAGAGPLDRDRFRAAANRVRERTALKGRALFHPIRVALTAADSGPELDLALPAMDRGALLPSTSGIANVRSCAERARLVVERL